MGGGALIAIVAPIGFGSWAWSKREAWLRSSTELSADQIKVAKHWPEVVGITEAAGVGERKRWTQGRNLRREASD